MWESTTWKIWDDGRSQLDKTVIFTFLKDKLRSQVFQNQSGEDTRLLPRRDLVILYKRTTHYQIHFVSGWSTSRDHVVLLNSPQRVVTLEVLPLFLFSSALLSPNGEICWSYSSYMNTATQIFQIKTWLISWRTRVCPFGAFKIWDEMEVIAIKIEVGLEESKSYSRFSTFL